MRPSLTVIMPAYEEAASLERAYRSVLGALSRVGILDYEILIMTLLTPQGTHDGTPDIACRIAEKDSRVKNVHSNFFTSLGYKYREGVEAASKEYVMMVPAHDLTVADSLSEIMDRIGQSDSIITYTINPGTRPLKARIVSKCFVVLCNILFGLNLRYYNGITVHRRELLKKVPMTANNHAYMAEIIIFLVKSGAKYIQMPQVLKPTTRAGKAFNLASAVDALRTLTSLFWKIHFRKMRVPTAELL